MLLGQNGGVEENNSTNVTPASPELNVNNSEGIVESSETESR